LRIIQDLHSYPVVHEGLSARGSLKYAANVWSFVSF